MLSPDQVEGPTDRSRLRRPAAVVVALQRPQPIGGVQLGTTQRLVVVGSGNWLYSYLSDAMVGVGGQRQVLVNPGNHALLMASVAWLSHEDELIARSPLSQQVARLDGITPEVRRRWRFAAVVCLPALCGVTGFMVLWRRRRSA